MIYGTVVRSQVPMFMSFNEDHVLYVGESLVHSLESSYQIIDFFTVREDEDEVW